MKAIRSVGLLNASFVAFQRDSASQFLISSRLTSQRRCSACRQPKDLRSVPVLLRRACAARSITIHLKCVAEKFGQRQTTLAACRAGSAMAKRFTFGLPLSRLQRSDTHKAL